MASHTAAILVPHLKKTDERIRKSTERVNKEIREENTMKGLTRTLQCERQALEYYKGIKSQTTVRKINVE